MRYVIGVEDLALDGVNAVCDRSRGPGLGGVDAVFDRSRGPGFRWGGCEF